MLGEADRPLGPLAPAHACTRRHGPRRRRARRRRASRRARAAGGTRLRTALLTVLAAIVDDGLAPQAAVERPRVHPADDVVNAEPGADETVLTTLESRAASSGGGSSCTTTSGCQRARSRRRGRRPATERRCDSSGTVSGNPSRRSRSSGTRDSSPRCRRRPASNRSRCIRGSGRLENGQRLAGGERLPCTEGRFDRRTCATCGFLPRPATAARARSESAPIASTSSGSTRSGPCRGAVPRVDDEPLTVEVAVEIEECGFGAPLRPAVRRIRADRESRPCGPAPRQRKCRASARAHRAVPQVRRRKAESGAVIAVNDHPFDLRRTTKSLAALATSSCVQERADVARRRRCQHRTEPRSTATATTPAIAIG